MKKMENGYSMVGQVPNFSEDFERISQQESIYLLEEQLLQEKEIWEYETRIPAKIIVMHPPLIQPNPEDEEEEFITTDTFPF